MFGAYKMNPKKENLIPPKYRIMQRYEDRFTVQSWYDDVWLNIYSFDTEIAARNYVENLIKRDNFKPRVIAVY